LSCLEILKNFAYFYLLLYLYSHILFFSAGGYPEILL
jgi:hypothetical protein